MVFIIISNIILLITVIVLIIKYKKLKNSIVELYDYVGDSVSRNPILKLQNELKEYYKIENGLIKLKVVKN